jgi:micrococcal nuclease
MIHPKSALYNYKCKLIRVVDGDTIHADVDLGFHTWRKVSLRLADIDAPEIRTKDLEEKDRGLKSAHLLELKLLEENPDGIFFIHSKGVDSFGRSIATIFTESGDDVNTYLLETGNADKWVFNK